MKAQEYLYRIEETTRKGKRVRHLAEAVAASDEDARRLIIHTAFSEGGHVHQIDATTDETKYPGELPKRRYSGK